MYRRLLGLAALIFAMAACGRTPAAAPPPTTPPPATTTPATTTPATTTAATTTPTPSVTGTATAAATATARATPSSASAFKVLGKQTGRVTFQHPTWGRATLITSFRRGKDDPLHLSSAGTGYIAVFDARGKKVWGFNTGDQAWYTMRLHKPARDATDQISWSGTPAGTSA